MISFIQALFLTGITPANHKLHTSTHNRIITAWIVWKVGLIDPNSALLMSLRANVNVVTTAKSRVRVRLGCC